MKLTDFLSQDCITLDLRARDEPEALRELARLVAGTAGLPPERIERLLAEREAISSTGVGSGLAVPHCRVAGLRHIVIGLGLSRAGLDFASLDGAPAHIFVVLLSPPDTAGVHLALLSRTVTLFREATFRDAVLRARDAAAIHRLISTTEEEHLQHLREARGAARFNGH